MNLQLPIILADFTEFALGFLLFFISLFMIFIILIQRGKGGGLAGALTGTAQSAFGAKAGDTMTRVTLVVSLIWILLISVTILAMNNTDGDAANELLQEDGSSRVNVSIESDDSTSDDTSSEGQSSSQKIDLGSALDAIDQDSTGEDSADQDSTPDEATEEDTSPEDSDATSPDTTDDADGTEADTSDPDATEESSDEE